MAYTIHYGNETIEIADFDMNAMFPSEPGSIELKDIHDQFHYLTLGPGIPLHVRQNPENHVWVG